MSKNNANKSLRKCVSARSKLVQDHLSECPLLWVAVKSSHLRLASRRGRCRPGSSAMKSIAGLLFANQKLVHRLESLFLFLLIVIHVVVLGLHSSLVMRLQTIADLFLDMQLGQ